MKKLIVILFSIVGTVILVISFFDKNIIGLLASLLFYGIAVLEEKTNSLVVRITSFTIITMALLFSIGFIYGHREEIYNEILIFQGYKNRQNEYTEKYFKSLSDEELLEHIQKLEGELKKEEEYLKFQEEMQQLIDDLNEVTTYDKIN